MNAAIESGKHGIAAHAGVFGTAAFGTALSAMPSAPARYALLSA